MKGVFFFLVVVGVSGVLSFLKVEEFFFSSYSFFFFCISPISFTGIPKKTESKKNKRIVRFIICGCFFFRMTQ